MPNSQYWADTYIEKRVSPAKAIASIRSGQRVFIGSGCGEPQILVQALTENANRFSGLEIVRLLGRETASLTAIADKTRDTSLNIRSIYLGSVKSESIARQQRFITPMNMSDVPSLFLTRKLPLNVALVQVSPADDFGWMSLGISVDVTMAAARSADFVIAQVNPRMPRVMGQSFIHVNNVDLIVEYEEELLAVPPPSTEPSEAARHIGRHISKLIEDGSTLQIGLDATSQATMQGLSEKNDLGVHSQFLTDDMMSLYARGNINNHKKGFNEGKMVASMAVGSRDLYEFLNDNPAIDFHPSDYVNDPFIIAQHNRMVSLNVARTMDLTGQASAEASAATRFAGVSGIPDFVRGARRAPAGKSILGFFSTTETENGLQSNIVPQLLDTVVVVPRGDIHYVATEYGVVNLFGKSIQERVVAMITIAHPQFREELFERAKELGFIGAERNLGEAARAVYPVQLEKTIRIDDEDITIRPAKPVDERRIQEHYYSLPKEDILTRFFCQKTIFGRPEMESRSNIDYVNDLTLIAVVGDFGFGKVVGVAESMKIDDLNMTEVAFSISKEYQGKRLGSLFIKKLAAATRANGISGLIAYTFPTNKAMISLFKTLPYKVKSQYEDGDVILSCKFNELA